MEPTSEEVGKRQRGPSRKGACWGRVGDKGFPPRATQKSWPSSPPPCHMRIVKVLL